VSLANRVLLYIIFGIRPFFGYAECRFLVTCTQFAAHQLEQKPFFYALWEIVKRVLSCNPLFKNRPRL
jgi:putative component of membrane protein insertase Oxa1/YidC/SpoIIIJ protein YidD